MEMLRDLEQVNLITAEELNGYFFDHSIKRLFALILRGYNEDRVDASSMTASFRVRHIDSPLFSDAKLKVLVGVKFRNVVWQSIVCQLSLSQQQRVSRVDVSRMPIWASTSWVVCTRIFGLSWLLC